MTHILSKHLLSLFVLNLFLKWLCSVHHVATEYPIRHLEGNSPEFVFVFVFVFVSVLRGIGKFFYLPIWNKNIKKALNQHYEQDPFIPKVVKFDIMQIVWKVHSAPSS